MLSDALHTTQLPQANTTMAPPEKPRDAHKMDFSSLMSPPDPIVDSFSNSATHSKYTASEATTDNVQQLKVKPNQTEPLPMSPPISPYSQAIAPSESTSMHTPSTQTVKDPVLYPQDDNHSSSSPAHSPLFASVSLDHQRLIDHHIRNRSPSISSKGPKREDYEAALFFKSRMFELYQRDRGGWLKRCHADLKAINAASGPKRYPKIMPAKPTTVKQPRVNRAEHRVSKPTAAPRAIRANGVTGMARPTGRISATPDPSRRIVAPNREDKDFESLPDFSPPLSSLDGKTNTLKVEWKGSPIDLSGDPLAKLLHEYELQLAGTLRLDCATYLTSKRRMFMRRLECIGIPKDFRKTDAQQACKIDVNKASKLHSAFARTGWLDQAWMEPHMHRLGELN